MSRDATSLGPPAPPMRGIRAGALRGHARGPWIRALLALTVTALGSACGPATPSLEQPLDAATTARHRRAEDAVRAAGHDEARAVASAAGFVFVLRPEGIFSPMIAVPDAGPPAPVELGLTFHQDATITARAIPLEGHDELILIELQSDYSPAEGGSSRAQRYAVLRVGSGEVACRFLGDESTQYAEPMAGLPAQYVSWSIDDQAEGLALLVRVQESHRDHEGHQRETTVRYTLPATGSCERSLVALRSNHAADYVEEGLPVPEELAGADDAGLALLRDAARDAPSLLRYVDPAQGLILVEAFVDASGEDPRAGPGSLVRVAERLCGDALGPVATRLQRDLALRVEDPEGVRLRCEGLTCTHDAFAEFDLTGTYRFAETADGPKLIEVVRIEGGGVSEEWSAAQRVWADEQLARLRATPCP